MDKSVNKKRDQLQLLVGQNYPVSLEQLANWAGTEYRSGLIVVRPTTLGDLQKVVRAAVSLNLRVRAVGNALSSTPAFPEEGQVAVYLENLARVDGGPRIELFRNESEPLESELTALSSVTVQELLTFQVNQGVELLTNVVSRAATIGGIVTTATHGTGLHCKSICDMIVRMRVVDATGELRTYDNSDEEAFNAVRGCLGLFGIIYDVTFRVTPLSVVQIEDRWIPSVKVFYEKGLLAALIHNNVSIELHWCLMNSVGGLKRMQAVAKKRLDANAWDPSRDEIYVRTVNRPPGPVTPNTEEWFENRVNPLNKIYKSRHWFALKVPSTLPMVTHKMVSEWKSSFMGTLIQTVPNAINYFAYSEPFPLWNMEFSFNLDTDCTNVQFAIMQLVEMVQAEAQVGRFPVVKVSVRFTAASDIYLCPSYAGSVERGGNGNTFHVDIESFPGTPGWHEFAAQLALRWLQVPGARPNWGRQWHFIPGIINHLKLTCGPELTQFRKALEKHGQDKTHMFFTDFLEDLLYKPYEANPDPVPELLAPVAQPVTQAVIPTAQHSWEKASVFIVPRDKEQVVQPKVCQTPILGQPQPYMQQVPNSTSMVHPQPTLQQLQQVPNGNQFQTTMVSGNQQQNVQTKLVPGMLSSQGQYPMIYQQPAETEKKKKKWWQFGRSKSYDDNLHQIHQQQQQPMMIAAPNNMVAVKGYKGQNQQQIVYAQQNQPIFTAAPAASKSKKQKIPLITPEKANLYYPGQGQVGGGTPYQAQVMPNQIVVGGQQGIFGGGAATMPKPRSVFSAK